MSQTKIKKTEAIPLANVAAPSSGFFSPSLLIPLYVFVIIITFALLHNGYATVKGNELSRERSLFAAVNAATLTGFQQSTNINDYTPGGQWLMLGATIAGILFSFIAGGTAVARLAKLRYTDGHIAFFSLMSIAMVVVFCAIPLQFCSDEISFFAAIFQVVSAFGNSGLHLGHLGSTAGLPMQAILLPLAVLGGLGVTVLMELTGWIQSFFSTNAKSAFSLHARQVLIWTAGAYLVGVSLLVFLQLSKTATPWPAALMSASQQTINSRSLGFPFSLGANTLVIWATMALMLIGANSAGTGGGLKLTTLSILSRGTRSALKGDAPGRMFGIAMVWMAIYLALVAVTQLMLLSSDPQISGDRLLFLSISALGNVGQSHDPIALSNPGLMTVSATMLAGRVLPVLILWWAADTVTEETETVG